MRKFVANGVLSPDDVRAVLFEAAKSLDLFGSELTPEAAQTIVNEELASRGLDEMTNWRGSCARPL